MTAEQEQLAVDESRFAWQAFQLWTGSQDVDRFRDAYIGRYPDRETFGQELLSSMGAEGRLNKLPQWLRSYVRLDGAAIVADFERAGHYYVYEAPEDGGAYVFDGYS